MLPLMAWAPARVWFSVPALLSVAVPVQKLRGLELALLRLSVPVLLSVLMPPAVKPNRMRSSPPMVSVPWLFQVLPPTSTNEVGPGALSVLVAWVVKLPGPARVALEPVTVKSPVMVTAAVPPRVPPLPLMARLGRIRGLVVLKFSTPPLSVTGARVPEAAVGPTLSVPLLTLRAAAEAAELQREVTLTGAPVTASVPRPVTLVPAPRVRVPPAKLSVAP